VNSHTVPSHSSLLREQFYQIRWEYGVRYSDFTIGDFLVGDANHFLDGVPEHEAFNENLLSLAEAMDAARSLHLGARVQRWLHEVHC
jgi:hypothetical protein